MMSEYIFSESFVRILVSGALIMTAAAALLLVALMVIDLIKKQVW